MRSLVPALGLLTSAAAFSVPPVRQHVFGHVSSPRPAKLAARAPHGGALVDLFKGVDTAKEKASCTKTVQLNDRQLCDVELVCNGGFSPLTGFMDEPTYLSVVKEAKLPSGLLFSLPVVFDTDDESVQPGDKILLKQDDRDIATLVC
jgi:sulfate adenylyltransferase